MNAFVIWIDREHAKIFQLSDQKMERKNITSSHTDHHTHAQDGIDHQRQEHALFSKAVTELKDAEKILILGPGVAKYHFRIFLMEQFPALSRKIVACEAMDHPTDAQIAAYAKKYFEIGTAAPAGGR